VRIIHTNPKRKRGEKMSMMAGGVGVLPTFTSLALRVGVKKPG